MRVLKRALLGMAVIATVELDRAASAQPSAWGRIWLGISRRLQSGERCIRKGWMLNPVMFSDPA